MNGTLIRGCALASAGVLATLALSGCGGGDTTSADPTPSFSSASSSRSAASTSAAPVDESTSAAAGESPEEFVRRWNEANTEMQNADDIAEYLALSKGCEACAKTAMKVSGYYTAGGFVRTTPWALSHLRCLTTTPSATRCTAEVVYGPTEYAESSSGQTERLAGGSFRGIFSLTTAPGQGWTLINLEQQPS